MVSSSPNQLQCNCDAVHRATKIALSLKYCHQGYIEDETYQQIMVAWFINVVPSNSSKSMKLSQEVIFFCH